MTNFGVFAELEEGVEGLIHNGDLSWTKPAHPSELVKVGDKIEVVILDIDEANRKLSLGHKQLQPNPWDEIESKYGVGSVIEATIASIDEKGNAKFALDGIDGTCSARDLVKEDGSAPVVGETLSFKVVGLKKQTKTAVLSHVKTYAAPEKKAEKAASESVSTDKAVKMINNNVEKTTLGDIDALAALKEKLEKGE